MSDSVKETPNLLRPKGVRWTEEDWENINRVAALMAERDHRETDASEVIRMATRRFVADELARAAEAA